jgi:two-component system, response regulator, stage 0 sporulation protein F
MSNQEKQYQVIIVDDQHDVRKVLRGGLESMGKNFQVVDTPSAEEAWLVLSNQQVDLLVLDVRLPGISGLDFLKRLRSRKSDLKVILITGVADPVVRQQAVEAQADAFFLKPISLNEFQCTVRQLLEPGMIAADDAKTAELNEENSSGKNLQGMLAELVQATTAKGGLLLGRDGKVLFHVGPLPQWLTEVGWIHSLVLSYRIGIRKLFSDKTTSNDSALSIKGPGLQLAFFPMNADYILLLWSEKEDGLIPNEAITRLSAEIQEALTASPPMTGLQKKAGEEPSSASLPPISLYETNSGTEQTDEIETISRLFQRGRKDRLGTKELNNFWETLVSDSGSSYARERGGISFEEARQMGLAPDGEEETPE